MAVAVKQENPARTAAQVRRILRAQMGWAPGERDPARLPRRRSPPGDSDSREVRRRRRGVWGSRTMRALLTSGRSAISSRRG